MVDEFAKYAKTERKINKLTGNLNSYSKIQNGPCSLNTFFSLFYDALLFVDVAVQN